MKRAKGDSFPSLFLVGFLRLAKYDHARHGLTFGQNGGVNVADRTAKNQNFLREDEN